MFKKIEENMLTFMFKRLFKFPDFKFCGLKANFQIIVSEKAEMVAKMLHKIIFLQILKIEYKIKDIVF